MASGKVLKTMLLFGGKIDKSFSGAFRAAESKAAQSSRNMSNSMSNAMNTGFKKVLGTALKVFALVKSIGKLKDFAQESMEAYKDQITAETKLETLLKNVGSIAERGPNAAKEAANRLKGVAGNLQKVGVIGDEVTIAGMQQLASFQLSEEVIGQLSVGMTDLLAQTKGVNATQSDAVGVANLIGKAMSGQTGALSKVGIIMDENQKKMLQTGDETQRAAALAEILQQNVGGVNKALAETDDGKLQQMRNTMGDLKEVIGSHITPLYAQIVSNMLPYMEAGVEKITAKMEQWGPIVSDLIDSGFARIDSVLTTIDGALDQNSGTITAIKENVISLASAISESLPDGAGFSDVLVTALTTFLELLASVTESLATMAQSGDLQTFAMMVGVAFAVTKIVSFVTAIISIGSTIMGVLVPAITFICSPVGMVVAAIVGLIALVVLLVRHWDQVKAAGLATWQSLQTNIATAVANISARFEAFKTKCSNALNAVRSVASSVAGAIRSFFSPVASIFDGIASKISSVSSKISGLIGKANSAKATVSNVPGMSTGGTVTSPTLALVGEGKYAETVIPHHDDPRSRALLQTAAKGMGVSLGGKGGNTYVYSPTINMSEGKSLKEELKSSYEDFLAFMRKYEDEENREVFA